MIKLCVFNYRRFKGLKKAKKTYLRIPSVMILIFKPSNLLSVQNKILLLYSFIGYICNFVVNIFASLTIIFYFVKVQP